MSLFFLLFIIFGSICGIAMIFVVEKKLRDIKNLSIRYNNRIDRTLKYVFPKSKMIKDDLVEIEFSSAPNFFKLIDKWLFY